MSTVAELERLNALTQRLVPVSDVQRGELIRAGDWNLVTGALIELARVVMAESKADIVSAHEHVEEVDIGWLTPRLRALIEQGGLSDPVASKRLATIERDSQKLKEQIDNLLKELGSVRVNLKDVKIGDIGRESEMVILRRKFEAQADARDEVLGLRQTLDVIEQNIDRALEFGESISVDGEIPDLREVIDRISSLETLRERLTGSDGTLFDATAFDIRLAELQNKFISQEQLDDALKDVRTRPPQDMVDALEMSLQGYVDEQLTTTLDTRIAELDDRFVNGDSFEARLSVLSSDILAQTDENLSSTLTELNERYVNNDEFESRLGQLSGSLQEQLKSDVNSQVSAQLATALDDLDTRYVTNAVLTQRLGTFATQLESDMFNTLRGEIAETVNVEMQERGSQLFVSQELYKKEITTIRQDIEEISRRSIDDSTRIRLEAESALAAEASSGSPSPAEADVLEEEMAATVKEQVDQALETSLADIRTDLASLQSLESRLLTQVSNQINAVRQEMNTISRQVVVTELQNIQNQVSTLQDEIRMLNNRISTNIQQEVATTLTDFAAVITADLNVVKQQISHLQNREVTIVADESLSSPDSAFEVDNLIEIDGIGEAFNERLLNQGIHTFAALAALSDEELATILGTTPTNLRRWNIQEQAAKKAQAE